MVEVLVEYDYAAQEPDELTIKKGDIIKDVVKKPGGWWEGVLHDKKGVFPDNFVKQIEKESVTLRNKNDSARIRQCRVVFSYNQDHEDELNLKVGDLINIICEEEEGWWRGILNGKEGVFPSNFVEEVTPVQNRPKPSSREDLIRISDDVPVLPAKPVKQLCEVRYSYKAQNEDELNLKEGDIVTILSKDCQDPGWWKGELNGKVGVFPDNFVAVLPLGADDLSKKVGISSKFDSKPSTDTSAIKHSSIASQRKSLEIKNIPPKPLESTKTTPPLPGKKPIISIKKSPSSSGSGIFSKLKDKIVDAVDGATGSKPKTDLAKEVKENHAEGAPANANVFDQVERRPLLSDVRANRARAPGRRLPTSVYKEDDEEIPGLPNGTAEHGKLDTPAKSEHSIKSEDSFRSEGSISSDNLDNSLSDLDNSDVKPKLREWEKHKAPWLDEMKKNQAKRTSVSPVPDLKPRVLQTPEPIHEPEVSKSSHNSPVEKEVHLVDMSKSLTDMKMSPVDLKGIAKPFKTTPVEVDKAPPIKSKPLVSSLSSVNRQSIGATQGLKDSPIRTVPQPQPVKVTTKPKTELYENTVIQKSQSGGFSNISSTISTGFSSHSTSSVSHTTSEKVVSSSSTVISGSNVTSSANVPSKTGFMSTGSNVTSSANLTNKASYMSPGSNVTSTANLPNEAEGMVSLELFNKLMERVEKLESRCDKQGQEIDDLRNRLRIETDLRIMLQEKVSQNNVQV